MKTEIKFRGKALSGEWVIGNFIHSKRFKGCSNEFRIHESETGIEHDVHPDSVGQFTGYHDSQQSELYHKDIVRFTYPEFTYPDKAEETGYGTIECIVEQVNGCWVFLQIGFDYSKSDFTEDYTFVATDAHDCVKIGAAFENPELITKKQNDICKKTHR